MSFVDLAIHKHRHLQEGWIRIREIYTGVYSGDTVDDSTVLSSVCNTRYFKESEYDEVLFKCSEFGFGLEQSTIA